jgi:transposase
MAKKGKRRCDALPGLHLDAAGIDVGASELFVAIGADRDPHPVRSFDTFTRDLHALADWLVQCGIRSVPASTGFLSIKSWKRADSKFTATAHKLARIVFHLLSTEDPYNGAVFHEPEEDTIRRAEMRLRKQAAHLGFHIVPAKNG